MTTMKSELTPMEHALMVSAQRVNTPIPIDELERRWALVRDVMEADGVDALFIHSHVEGLGGATRWFADLPGGGGYPTSLVFSRAEPMTLISHGPIGGDRRVAPGDPVLRGIDRVLSTASFCSATYCQHYDSDLALTALRRLKPRTVGLVYPAQMPYPMVEALIRGLDGVEVIDVSASIDALKSVKSAHEQELIRATAQMQDDALAYAFSIARPGMRESQVMAAAQQFCAERGSESGVYMAGSAPIGEPAMFQLRHNQERVIQDGDALTINLENSGAGGYYSHVGRMGLFGTATQQMQEELALALEGQALCVDMLRPGVAASEIFAAYDDFLRGHGRPAEKRLHCHGQGYDVVERPLIRGDETMKIEAGMHIGCHPMWVYGGLFVYVCDNYLVQADGPPERIHRTTPQIVEV